MVPYDSETLLALISQYYLDSWPAQIIMFLLLLLLLGQLFKKSYGRGRIASAILCIMWCWNAIFFLLKTYTAINWFGLLLAEIFGFQAFLLFLWGITLNRLCFDFSARQSGMTGFFWLGLILIASPGLQYYFNRNYLQLEYFAMMPDQLVAMTLVFLLYFTGKLRWYLLFIPVLWVGYSLIWSVMLGDPSRLILPVISLLLILWYAGQNLIYKRRESVST